MRRSRKQGALDERKPQDEDVPLVGTPPAPAPGLGGGGPNGQLSRPHVSSDPQPRMLYMSSAADRAYVEACVDVAPRLSERTDMAVGALTDFWRAIIRGLLAELGKDGGS